jgi:tetratricopeptide (TPR) repeat protein
VTIQTITKPQIMKDLTEPPIKIEQLTTTNKTNDFVAEQKMPPKTEPIIKTDDELSSQQIVINKTSDDEITDGKVDIGVLYYKGMTALKNDEWEKAVHYFTVVKEINPEFRDIANRLIEANVGLTNNKELKELTTFYNQGMIEFNDHNWKKAIIYFEKAQILNPDYGDTENLIAEAKSQLGNKNPVQETTLIQPPHQKGKNILPITCLICSMIIIPVTIVFFLSPSIRARYYLLQGKPELARQLYEQHIAKNPKDIKAYITLTNIYLSTNHEDDSAIKAFKLTLPNDLKLKNNRKKINIINKNNNKAVSKNVTLKDLKHTLHGEIKNLG